MFTKEQKEAILKLVPDIKFDEPMSWHTYFRIGGPADAFLAYTDSRDTQPLKNVLKFCADKKIPLTGTGKKSFVLRFDL